MAELEFESTNGEQRETEETDPTVVDLPTDGGGARLTLPADATEDEVAALIAAVASSLGGEGEEGDTADQRADAWKLAGRLGSRRRFELPRECRQGGEWKAAGRRPNV